MPQVLRTDRSVEICRGQRHVVECETEPVLMGDIGVQTPVVLNLRCLRGVHGVEECDIRDSIKSPAYTRMSGIAAVSQALHA